MMDLASINNPFLGRNPPQFGYATGVPNSLYRSTSAPVSNAYGSKVKKMPGTWDLFKTVVTTLWTVVALLLSVVCFLVWFYFSSMRDDLNTIRRDLSENATGIRRDLSDARVEFTKVIGNVEKEVATTNGKLDATNAKLDSIVLELHRALPHH
jgi:hypothetical protein